MRRGVRGVVFLILFLVAAWVVDRRGASPGGNGAEPASAGEAAILSAFEAERSDTWVSAAGVVERVLADDLSGSRHQRFILRLPSGNTVLISHNIDLAPRIDGLGAGDPVAFRGEYEWNAQGGVVHWTHHDPQGRRPGGWLDHDGRRYE